MSSVYEDIQKPSSFPFGVEIEGRCPLCNTVMRRCKSASGHGRLYMFSFPIYICLAHYHGYFRWLGGRRGHVRILFPQILKHGKDIGSSKYDDQPELITIQCKYCGFTWGELKIRPLGEETVCPECHSTVNVGLRCYKCGEVPQPCCEDRDKYLEWNIQWLEEKLKSKSGYFPFFSSSIGCFHCGFSNAQLTAIGRDHCYLVWCTCENIKDIENKLTKAVKGFFEERESSEEERLRMCKETIDEFFRKSSEYFRKLKDVSVYSA